MQKLTSVLPRQSLEKRLIFISVVQRDHFTRSLYLLTFVHSCFWVPRVRAAGFPLIAWRILLFVSRHPELPGIPRRWNHRHFTAPIAFVIGISGAAGEVRREASPRDLAGYSWRLLESHDAHISAHKALFWVETGPASSENQKKYKKQSKSSIAGFYRRKLLAHTVHDRGVVGLDPQRRLLDQEITRNGSFSISLPLNPLEADSINAESRN